MNNPLMIRSMCARCGEDLEVYYGITTDVLIADVIPCSKCLKSQTEDMVETIEKVIRDMDVNLESDEIYALEQSIGIIKEVGGLE